jgi:hypothetical protein
MTAFLFEGHRTVYIVLAIVLVILLVAWWQTRKRSLLVAGAVVVGLIGLYFLLDLFVETEQEADRNQIQSRIEEMAQSIHDRDPEKLFRHIGDKFVSPLGKNRTETHKFARDLITSGTVRSVRVWGFEFAEQPRRAKGEATISFQFKVDAPSVAEASLAFPCDATFEWAGARGWLLREVVIHNPVRTGEVEKPF